MDFDKKIMSPCRVRLERLEIKTPAKQLALSAELRKVINERNILTVNSRKKMIIELDQLEEQKRREEKRRTLEEILTSELAYIKQIEQIQVFFMNAIKRRKLLSAENYNTLFNNIDAIYQVNGALVEELKEDLMHLTSAFNKMAPFLKLYSEYAFNFKNSMSILDSLMHKNVAFCKFVQGQETRPEVQNKLSSLLIAPIQRIPRYCLLIKQVLDNTNKTEEDYNILEETYEKLCDVAKHIDAAVEERQNFENLISLSKRVKQGKSLIILPGRKLIMEGAVKIFQSDKTYQDMYLILFSDIIMFCSIRKVKFDEPNSLKCTSIFPLNKCAVSQGANMMITIRCDEERHVFYSEHGCTAEWFRKLKHTLRVCALNRSTLRKGSSSRRPAVHFDFSAYEDAGVSPGASKLKLRKKRRLGFSEEQEDNLKEATPKPKRIKIECRRSIKTMIPKVMAKPKALLRGFQKKSAKIVDVKHEPYIKQETDENSTTNLNRAEVKKDALFPLRTHFLSGDSRESSAPSTSTSGNSSYNALVPYPSNLYVFGENNNRNRAFSFNGMISGLTNSFRKAFGFR